MKVDKWLGLGGFACLLVLVNRLRGHFVGELMGFTLIFCLLGVFLTQRLLVLAQAPTRRAIWGLFRNELVFICQGLVWLLLVMLPADLFFNHDLLPTFGRHAPELIRYLTRVDVSHFAMTSWLSHLWPVWTYLVLLTLWVLGAWLAATVPAKFSQYFKCYVLAIAGLSLVGILVAAVKVAAHWDSFLNFFYALPFALGSFLAVGFFQHRQGTMVSTTSIAWVPLGIGAGGLLLSSLFSFERLSVVLLVFLLASLCATWLVFLVIKAQGAGVTQATRQLFRWGLLSYLFAWPLATILPVKTASLRLVIALMLSLVLGYLSLAFFRRYDRSVVKAPGSAKRQDQLLLVAVVCLGAVAGSFSIHRVTANAHPATTKQAAMLSQSKPGAKATNKSTNKLPQLSQRLTKTWRQIIAPQTAKIDIAVYSPTTRQVYHYSKDAPGTPYYTASSVKVSILTQLLHERDQGNLTLNATDQANAATMIRNSDNAAATYLLDSRLGGYQALNTLFSNLEMQHSQDVAVGHWGHTQTTATDQVNLLRMIYYQNNYLSTASRQYIKQLMGSVSPEQSWGISSGASQYQLKNGWLSEADNSWIVASIGHVASAKSPQGYVIAIYTNGNADLNTGITLVERLAKATHTEMTKAN